MTDTQIEQEIQANGLTAPRITPADIEANIASEHYFTGSDGAFAVGGQRPMALPNDPLLGVQFCVLVLKNGHLVTGESLLQDLSKPDPERARASARRRAFDKAYDMVVYAERERLAAAKDQSIPAVGVAWTVIDRSNPDTLPPKGEWLVTVDTDDGREVQVLLHEGNGKWLHDGEYTFRHGYYFRPAAWATRPAAYSGPMPSEA